MTGRRQRPRTGAGITHDEVASDAEIRALVSDSPGAAHEGTQAARHLTSMKSARAALVDEITQLESKVDTLLDRLAEAGT